ncbi:MAG TPA: hypothetical protein VGH28_22090 [Polyangiaceae bacterium]
MHVRWKVLIAVVAIGAAKCSTAPPCSNHSAPHATFDVASGCVGYYCAMNCEPGFIDCDGEQSNGCETSTTSGLPPHTVLDPNAFVGGGCGGGGSPLGTIGQCNVECEPGFFDCDKNQSNGCETSSSVGCPAVKVDASSDAGLVPERLASISSAPGGLVACAGNDYFFDGSELRSIDGITLLVSDVALSPAPPTDGLACDGDTLFWSASLGDAGTGALYGVPVLGGTPIVVASGFDPSPGVAVRDGGVLVMSSAGLLFAQGDGGAGAWMPATPTGAYEPFALVGGEDWSIANGAILRRTDDAGTSTWIDDAGAPSTLVSANGRPMASIHATFDDAGATSDWLARLEDDGGAPTVSPIFTTAKPVVAAASGTKAVVATDATIYVVTPNEAQPLFTTPDHVVDVALDGNWVIWTTWSNAGVWRGALP